MLCCIPVFTDRSGSIWPSGAIGSFVSENASQQSSIGQLTLTVVGPQPYPANNAAPILFCIPNLYLDASPHYQWNICGSLATLEVDCIFNPCMQSADILGQPCAEKEVLYHLIILFNEHEFQDFTLCRPKIGTGKLQANLRGSVQPYLMSW